MPNLLLPLASLALPLVAAGLRAQAPTAASTDLTALAARVDAAHRPGGPAAPVTSLAAAIQLHLVDKTAEQRGQVDLLVRALELQPRPGRRPETLLRYEVRGTETPVVRGRDGEGPWQLERGEPRDLDAADAAEDRKALERHTNLVRQMLRFLAPGDVLRSLQQPTAVRDADLVLNARTSIACQAVGGRLPAFPLLQEGGADVPVDLEIWVEKASGRVVAVDAWPLAGDRRDPARGERVLLRDLQEKGGLLVPFTMAHLFRGADGKLALKSEAKLTELELRKPMTPESFDRTK